MSALPRRIALAAFFVTVACEDGQPEPLTHDSDWCTVVAIMDDLCEGWREDYDRSFADGCYAAAYTIAERRHGANIGQEIYGLGAPEDACLDE